MEKYNEKAKCPKCGYDFISVIYEKLSFGSDGTLKRECQRCGYSYYEMPLDSLKETGQSQ